MIFISMSYPLYSVTAATLQQHGEVTSNATNTRTTELSTSKNQSGKGAITITLVSSSIATLPYFGSDWIKMLE